MRKTWPQLERELRDTVLAGQMTIEDALADVAVVSTSSKQPDEDQ